MTDEELLLKLKENSSEFSNDQLLEVAMIADEAYKRNFCKYYEPEDFIEEFVDNFLESLQQLPPAVAQQLKQKILSL